MLVNKAMRTLQSKNKGSAAKLSPAISLLALVLLALTPSNAQASGPATQGAAVHNPNVTRVLVQTRLRHVREATRKAAEEAQRRRSTAPANGSPGMPKSGR